MPMPPADPLLASHTQARYSQPKSHRPFDPDLLCAKLEVAKREQDAARARKEKRDSLKTGFYVPQNAAYHMLSTTTAPQEIDANEKPRHVRGGSKFRESDMVSDMGVKNSEPPYAPLSVDMLENEFAADGTVSVTLNRNPISHSGNDQRERSYGHEVGQERRKRRDYHYDRQSVAVLKGFGPASTSKAPGPHSYRPGDEAHRRTQASPSQTKVLPVQNGSHVTYETIPLGFTPISATQYSVGREKYAADGRGSVYSIENKKSEAVDLVQRPRLYHDRPNWAQQSECGDGVQASPDVRQRQKNDQMQTVDGTEQPLGGFAAVAATRLVPESQQRQKNVGSLPETLISDAVARIKREERSKKRSSVLGFFKRL